MTTENNTLPDNSETSNVGSVVMSKAQQIDWLIDWYLSHPPGSRPTLCATDFTLECEFTEASGVELSYATWRSRIREAAGRLGLSGWRAYSFDGGYGSAVPKYSMVYS